VSLLGKLSRLASTAPLPSPSPGPADRAPPQPDRAGLLDDLRARIRATIERSARRGPAPLPSVETVDLRFTTVETPKGPLHARTRHFGASHRTGQAQVSRGRDASAELLALLALDPRLADCDPARALFLDTETTGLAGGTGTVAFLVGLASWEGDGLVLEQLLVRALGEEAPMLERLRERIGAASMLVTFNGKSFDMPLLRTRFVMSRETPPAEPPHLDLLHVARRIHGRRAGDGCRLVALERDVLGFERVDDVPSSEVGACYMHFLRTGDGRALLGVVEHNAWDVVAMAALVGLYGEPEHGALAPCDLVGVARTLRRAGSLDRAMVVADAAVERSRAPESLPARPENANAHGRLRSARQGGRRALRAPRAGQDLRALAEGTCRRSSLGRAGNRRERRSSQATNRPVAAKDGESPALSRRRDERRIQRLERRLDVGFADHERRRHAKDVAVESAPADEQSAASRFLEQA
jgi:uncharacterized protein YprB with RNaseH-like and TPR domain